jgi:hypothetical protein
VPTNWLADKTFSSVKIIYVDALMPGRWQFGIRVVSTLPIELGKQDCWTWV